MAWTEFKYPAMTNEWRKLGSDDVISVLARAIESNIAKIQMKN